MESATGWWNIFRELNILLSETDERTTKCICSRVLIREPIYYADTLHDGQDECEKFNDKSSFNTDEAEGQLQNLNIIEEQYPVPSPDIESAEKEDSDLDYVVIDESEAMSALGLPTQFGAKKKHGRKGGRKHRGNKDTFSKYILPSMQASNQVATQVHTLISAEPIFSKLGYYYENPSEKQGHDLFYENTNGQPECNLKENCKTNQTENAVFCINELSENSVYLKDSAANEKEPFGNSIGKPSDQLENANDSRCNGTVQSSEHHNESALPLQLQDIVPSPNGLAKKKKKKSIPKCDSIIPKEILNERSLKKYWLKRYSLFSLYDQGIQLDKEAWFSATPECIAIHTAERLRCDVIVDAFCGTGGNSIQFAKTCNTVIAIDIDPNKVEMAKNNAKIYGVINKIQFIVGDFLQLASSLTANIVFLSPPWGGPSYKYNTVYDLEEHLQPLPATELFEMTSKITKNIAMYLPRNSNTQQLIRLAGAGNSVEVEQNCMFERTIAITAYYGDLANVQAFEKFPSIFRV